MLMPAYFLMTPALGGDNVDIIAVQTEEELCRLYAWRKAKPWVSVLHTHKDDAYKLLIEQGGFGIGCYVEDKDNRQRSLIRRAVARVKLANFRKLCRAIDPRTPCVIELAPPIERQRKDILTIIRH